MQSRYIAPQEPSSDEQLAHHEAGHAVVAWARSVRLQKLFIGADRGRSIDSQGFRHIDPTFMSEGDWNYAKTKALILLAGEFAERTLHEIRGTSCDVYASAGDRTKLRELLTTLIQDASPRSGYSLSELETEADRLVVLHWDSIERLAQVLMVKHEISGAEAEAIIGSK